MTDDAVLADVTPNITVWRQAWATRNGCKGTPPAPSSVTHPHGNATAYEWDCSSAGVFKGYSINDLGHSYVVYILLTLWNPLY